MEYVATYDAPPTDWINIIIENLRTWWNRINCPKEENYFLIN